MTDQFSILNESKDKVDMLYKSNNYGHCDISNDSKDGRNNDLNSNSEGSILNESTGKIADNSVSNDHNKNVLVGGNSSDKQSDIRRSESLKEITRKFV